MATNAINLPPGFTLDSPNQPKLPPGFVVDKESIPQMIGRNFKNAVKETFSPETLLSAASIGPVGKVAGAAKFIAPSARIKLAERAQALIPKAQKGLSEAFESTLSALKGRVDMSDIVKQAGTTSAFNKGMRGVIRRSDLLEKYVKNPKLAKDLTARESQDLLNDISSSVKKAIVRGDVTPNDLPTVQITQAARARQLQAFPQLDSARKKYETGQEAIELLKSKLTPDNTLSHIRKSGFIPSQADRAFKRLGRAYDPELLKQASNYSLGVNALHGGLVAGGILGGAQILRNQLGIQQ